MNKIKFSILGCGRIAYRHIEAIEANPDAQLVAICDLDLERAKQRQREAKSKDFKLYQNYHQMLQDEAIDVVCVMSPSGMHPEHTIDIIQKYQKHIVLEKPIALRIQDGEELQKIVQKHGIHFFAVHQNRFNKAIQKIKSVIDDQSLGKINLATIRIRWSRGQSYYDRDAWRGTWAFDGGALTNQAIHHIDILQWFMGEVESVSAIAKTQMVAVEVEDTACAWVKFKNGALGVIEATTATRPLNQDLEASVSILGENGTVIVEGPAVNKLTTWTVGQIDLQEFSENPPNVYGFGHNVIINNVVDTLQGGGKPLIDVQEALKSVKILNALYKSIELGGEEVFLDQNPVSERFGVIRSAQDEQIANMYRTKAIK